MKAIILAGGLGTRLRPLTYSIPKALIPIAENKTLTEAIFDFLKKYGIKDIILSIGYMSEKIQQYFGNGKKFGLNIEYSIEEEPMGTAGPLILLKKFKETFVMINGDNLFDMNFFKMLEIHKKNNAVATIGLTSVKEPWHYGVAKLDKDKIIEFVEKPQAGKEPSRLINSGYYILEPKVFDIVKGKKYAMMEKDVFPILAQKGLLYGYSDSGKWFDTGTFERYELVKKQWAVNKTVHTIAHIRNYD